jgi:hypothetical protein
MSNLTLGMILYLEKKLLALNYGACDFSIDTLKI